MPPNFLWYFGTVAVLRNFASINFSVVLWYSQLFFDTLVLPAILWQNQQTTNW